MKAKINGVETEFENPMTLLTLLQSKGINPQNVTVEYNYEIFPRESWSNIHLKENDNIEIVQFIGGG